MDLRNARGAISNKSSRRQIRRTTRQALQDLSARVRAAQTDMSVASVVDALDGAAISMNILTLGPQSMLQECYWNTQPTFSYLQIPAMDRKFLDTNRFRSNRLPRNRVLLLMSYDHTAVIACLPELSFQDSLNGYLGSYSVVMLRAF